MKKLKLALALGGLFMTGLINSCKEEAVQPGITPELKTVFSSRKSYCNGTVRSFVVLGQDQKPVSLGFRFSENLLHELPIDPSRQIPNPIIFLPEEAKVTGIDHLEMVWNPRGHDPEKVYTFPHFDFNFFLVSLAEQEAVTPGYDPIPVQPQFIAPFYVSEVVAVPSLGVPFVDISSPEFNGRGFTATFIYGYYHGLMTFLQPMVTVEFLTLKPDFSFPVKQPVAFHKTGYYPLNYHIHFDRSTGEFVVALENLILRQGKVTAALRGKFGAGLFMHIPGFHKTMPNFYNWVNTVQELVNFILNIK